MGNHEGFTVLKYACDPNYPGRVICYLAKYVVNRSGQFLRRQARLPRRCGGLDGNPLHTEGAIRHLLLYCSSEYMRVSWLVSRFG